MSLWWSTKTTLNDFKRAVRGEFLAGNYNYTKGEYLGDGAFLKSVPREAPQHREGEHVLGVERRRAAPCDTVVVNSNQWAHHLHPPGKKVSAQKRAEALTRMSKATVLRVIDKPE